MPWFKTLDMGEQALIYNRRGKARIESGPKRIFPYKGKFYRLHPYSADQNQYLIIRTRDGNVLHQPGPCVVFLNPLIHKEIRVNGGIDLDANEVLVVYQRNQETKEVRRYLAHGPTRFIPDANEWLHQFRWHGTDPQNKTRMVEGQRTFTKLQVIPDQFYYNVDEVRTSDDALVRVKLMMLYELLDIEKMLTHTADPIADFINCLCADVIAFSAKLTYLEFIERSGELNEIENFPQLTEKCKKIGYSVGKVVFRGYYASPKLQELHDNTISKRTQMKLEYENEEQKQILTKRNLESEMKRIMIEHNLQQEQLQHRQKLDRSKTLHDIEIQKNEWTEKLEQTRRQKENTVSAKKAMEEQKVWYLKNLHEMEVDVNSYVLSQNPRPQKVVEVRTEKGAANLHLHQ